MTVRPPATRWVRPLLMAVASGVATLGCWAFFVDTEQGQRIDTLSYLGAQIGTERLTPTFESILEVVSVSGLALVMLAVALTALLRRRWLLALEAAVVVAAANISTRVLKYHLLDRPLLVDWEGLHNNTYPSGHSTAAASAMVAALLVAPRALRSLVAVVGATVMVVFGYGTLAAQWHRPSDVVGAFLVCFTWAFAALAVSGLRERLLFSRPPSPQLRPASRVVPTLMLLAGAFALAVAGLCAHRVWDITGIFVTTRAEQLTSYLGGAAGICGVAFAGMGLLLRGVQKTDLLAEDVARV